ncbi:MAG: pseudouridine-5'-phosphate glycosidase [Spirochaetia bacterium]|nr:pseudouridine-5'-phosphate glycosidase [Spirochaetia bacterium]
MDKNVLDFSPEVKKAMQEGQPVVALESTIISHGMPYPKNVQTALEVERIIREQGAVPATIAIIGGKLKVGLLPEEIDYLGKKGLAVTKTSRRDIPVLVAAGSDGATTVAATMIIAHMAGIFVFCTGGIGGVHRGATHTMDISADLEELAKTSVMVVCAGAKSILDIGLTLEYLETKGVPVLAYGTEDFPAFFTRQSGYKANCRVDSPKEFASILKAKQELGLEGGILVADPIPEAYSMDAAYINRKIDEAIEEANQKGIVGKALTPFLLDAIQKETAGQSLDANIHLVYNNATLAAQIAVDYQKQIGDRQ